MIRRPPRSPLFPYRTLFRSGVIRQNAAVTPATNSQPIWISNSLGNRPIDTGLQVCNFLVPPIRQNTSGELRPPPVASPIVDRQHDVSLRRKYLPLDLQWIQTKWQRVI